MTLLETIRTLEAVALEQHGVATVIEEELSKLDTLPDARYAVFAYTQGQHTTDVGGDITTYRLTISYIDRLAEDKSNRLEIQSTGMEVLRNILYMMGELDFEISSMPVQPFTQGLSDACAGVYCEVSIGAANGCTCMPGFGEVLKKVADAAQAADAAAKRADAAGKLLDSVSLFDYADLDRPLSEEEERHLRASTMLIVRNTPWGDRVLFPSVLPDRIIYWGLYSQTRLFTTTLRADHVLTTITLQNIYDLGAVRFTENQSYLSAAQRTVGRNNLDAVGWLCLGATLGSEADNRPLTLTSTLAEVQAAFALFRADPGRYRWSLSIHGTGETNPFVEEAALEPLQRDDGGLELLFTSKRSGMRYAVVLTADEAAITAARVEYRLTPEQRHYTARGATFDPSTGLFALNGIGDLTPAELETICALWNGEKKTDLSEQFAGSAIRTAFPIKSTWTRLNLQRAFQNCRSLRRIDIDCYVADMAFLCYGDVNVESVGYLNTYLINSIHQVAQPFAACYKLKTAYIKSLRYNFDFSDSPLLSFDSLQYLVDNAINTAAITVTVHPEVYARLTDPADSTWYPLNEQAAARKIAFATV
ncbi:hypothetical protein [Alistipes sp.]|uniref:hypothetical protein n=1 Tax=Alistipes sp. TaxID=1872444 RepID=UPI003AF1B85D